jgi:hypothetical protein
MTVRLPALTTTGYNLRGNFAMVAQGLQLRQTALEVTTHEVSGCAKED